MDILVPVVDETVKASLPVIPGKRNATRNPFPMRCTPAKNGKPWHKNIVSPRHLARNGFADVPSSTLQRDLDSGSGPE